MPEIRQNRTGEKRLLAVLTGLLLTGLFPPAHFSWVAWAALVPLFICLKNTAPLQALKLGLLGGMAHYLSLMYWIIFVLDHYGNLGLLLSIGPYFLLSFYLSLFTALFCWGMVKITRCVSFPWFFVAGLWVALEYLRAHFLSGFPWCLLGYTQYSHLQVIQIADIAGVYGISFLIVLSNGLVFSLLFRQTPKKKAFFRVQFLLGILLLSAAVSYGFYKTGSQETFDPQKNITCAIIQPNIDQSVKWDPAYQTKSINTYRRLTLSVSSANPRLVVWPETAVPFFFQDPSDLTEDVRLLVQAMHTDLLFGSPAYRRKKRTYVYYNRAYLLGSDGRTSFYDKVHLVPFGEYVPLKRFLFFVDRLVAAAGDFEPGKNVCPLRNRNLTIGPLVCFEAIFPELARVQVKKGAQILVNLTNDAWFGFSSAPYQHLAMSVLRAVENRRPLIRAANTGISAFISPSGKIEERSPLFVEATMIREVHPVSSHFSFYTRFGDVFALLFCAVSMMILLWCWTRTTGRDNKNTQAHLKNTHKALE
ncbi:MAG: apolipoprotein N-acyltransferase [Thermoplasmata archaeon]|nr:MAG: apolipoprotein N-acyltransferase [Thermoplasmata archaeon]